MSISGNPEKVASEAIARELEKAMKQLEEARQASVNLVNDAYHTSLREAEKRLREEFARAEEQLKSLISVLELELKSKVSSAKNEYLDAVLEKAKERIKALKADGDWYKNYLENVIKRLAAETEGKMIVQVASEDYELAKSLVDKYGNVKLELSSEPASILGGVIASSPDGTSRVDYSLDLLIQMEEYRLRGVASKVLFKE